MFKQTRLLLLPFLLLFGAMQVSADNTPATPSLYERLGGIYPIATVVDDFIERLLVNDTLNANPAIDAARHTVPKPGLKYLVTAFVAKAAGGPQSYSGRSMETSHAHLNITNAEWAAMMVDFHATLDQFKVPAAERAELVALLESVKGGIVTSAP